MVYDYTEKYKTLKKEIKHLKNRHIYPCEIKTLLHSKHNKTNNKQKPCTQKFILILLITTLNG